MQRWASRTASARLPRRYWTSASVSRMPADCGANSTARCALLRAMSRSRLRLAANQARSLRQPAQRGKSRHYCQQPAGHAAIEGVKKFPPRRRASLKALAVQGPLHVHRRDGLGLVHSSIASPADPLPTHCINYVPAAQSKASALARWSELDMVKEVIAGIGHGQAAAGDEGDRPFHRGGERSTLTRKPTTRAGQRGVDPQARRWRCPPRRRGHLADLPKRLPQRSVAEIGRAEQDLPLPRGLVVLVQPDERVDQRKPGLTVAQRHFEGRLLVRAASGRVAIAGLCPAEQVERFGRHSIRTGRFVRALGEAPFLLLGKHRVALVDQRPRREIPKVNVKRR